MRAGLIPWEDVNRLFPRGATARVYDVATGEAFMVWRLQGTFHADVEPLTRKDSEILRQICGGHWTQDRRRHPGRDQRQAHRGFDVPLSPRERSDP